MSSPGITTPTTRRWAISSRAAARRCLGVDHAWSLRLGAWLCGLACVPAIWRLGRVLDSDAAGLVMTALLVVDPNIVFQSTQARMYPPLLLASIVALTTAAKLFSRPSALKGETVRRAPAILLAVAIAVGLWSHSQMYAVLVSTLVTAIVLVWTHASRRSALLALAAVFVAMAIGMPGILKLFAKRQRRRHRRRTSGPALRAA